ncbi:MAG: hypothetical protein HYZ10_13095 [Ignavibacteriales bacterium]|nr:hypothetical protein [Ignavibacteriales bacterium]
MANKIWQLEEQKFLQAIKDIKLLNGTLNVIGKIKYNGIMNHTALGGS